MNIGLDLYAPGGLALVVFASSGDDQRYRFQIQSFAEVNDEIKQRGLLVLGVFGTSSANGFPVAGPPLPRFSMEASPCSDHFGLSLVDRDGRVILKSSLPLPPAQIFQVIDAITKPARGREAVAVKPARRWVSPA